MSFWPPLENLSPLDFPLELEKPPLDLSEENLLLEVDDISSSSLLCNSLIIMEGRCVNIWTKIKARSNISTS